MKRNLLSEILRKIRDEKGLNRSEIARELGISSQLYGQYEDDKIYPKLPFFKKYLETFNIDLLEYLKGLPDQVGEPSTSYASLREQLDDCLEKQSMLIETNNQLNRDLRELYERLLASEKEKSELLKQVAKVKTNS